VLVTRQFLSPITNHQHESRFGMQTVDSNHKEFVGELLCGLPDRAATPACRSRPFREPAEGFPYVKRTRDTGTVTRIITVTDTRS
jgi:hypothetical protein